MSQAMEEVRLSTELTGRAERVGSILPSEAVRIVGEEVTRYAVREPLMDIVSSNGNGHVHIKELPNVFSVEDLHQGEKIALH